MKSIALSQEFADYELKQLKDAGADLVVYSYDYEDYSGSGFAAVRKDGKWSYLYLGHCSCYGPLEDIHSIDATFTLGELAKIVEGHSDYEKRDSEPVMKEIRRRRFK